MKILCVDLSVDLSFIIFYFASTHSHFCMYVKIINKPSKSGPKLKTFEQSLRREVSVMKVLRHPNVVTLWEVINDRRSRKVGRVSTA